MRPGMIAFLIILAIIILKDPKIIDEVVQAFIGLLNSPPQG